MMFEFRADEGEYDRVVGDTIRTRLPGMLKLSRKFFRTGNADFTLGFHYEGSRIVGRTFVDSEKELREIRAYMEQTLGRKLEDFSYHSA